MQHEIRRFFDFRVQGKHFTVCFRVVHHVPKSVWVWVRDMLSNSSLVVYIFKCFVFRVEVVLCI